MRTDTSTPVVRSEPEAFTGRRQVGNTFEAAIALALPRALDEAAIQQKPPLAAMIYVARAAMQTASDLGENPEDATPRIAAGLVRGASTDGRLGADLFADVGEAVLRATNDRGGDLGVTTRRLLEGVADGADSLGVDVREAVSAAACGAMETAARLCLGATGSTRHVARDVAGVRPHRLVAAFAIMAWLMGSGVASAQETSTAPPPADPQTTEPPMHPSGSLGFHDVDAPIGIRWWFGAQKVGLDLGLGYSSNEVGDERFSDLTFDAGIPIALKRWDRVNFLIRPGIQYNTQQVDVEGGPGVTKDDDTALLITFELEAEVFLADRFSVSAAHGIGILNEDPALGESTSDYGTIGSNFTNIGFHVYLFGGP